MRLTWSKQPNERGLAKVAQAARGKNLKLDGREIAHVRPALALSRRTVTGWYWYCADDESGLRYRNTCDEPLDRLEDAQRQCEIYVRTQLGLPLKGKGLI